MAVTVDEAVSGYWEASLPAVAAAFGASYAALGAVTTIAALVAAFVEPVYGVLADRGHRGAVMAAGGIVFAASIAAAGAAPRFGLWGVAIVVAFLASGAFVGLAQAALAERSAGAEEAAMSRWAFAGELGGLAGAALAWLVATVGLGWQSGYAASAALLVLAVAPVVRAQRSTTAAVGVPDERAGDDGESDDGPAGLRSLVAALRRPGVLLVLVVLETANLGMDVLALFLGLWVADGLGLGAATGAAAVSVWSVTALVSDGLAVRFHDLVRHRSWLVGSAAVQIAAVVTLVLTRERAVVLACTVVASAARAGWYPTLLAGLYRSLPGRSGHAVSLWSAFGLLGGVFPLGLGLVADRVGLRAAVALLVVGPVSVAVFAWRRPPVG